MTQSRVVVSMLLWLLAGLGAREAMGAVIPVTTVAQKIGGAGGCSLQEAIYSANFDNNVAINGYDGSTAKLVATGCVPGSGDDIIVLPARAIFSLWKIVDDADNPTGPAATPIITSNITILADGATLQRTGSQNFRLFAVGSTGHLTIRRAYIRGFLARGGHGGVDKFSNGRILGGGGGGMGAGGAIYVRGGVLVVEASTFEGNIAFGGQGGSFTNDGGGAALAATARPVRSEAEPEAAAAPAATEAGAASTVVEGVERYRMALVGRPVKGASSAGAMEGSSVTGTTAAARAAAAAGRVTISPSSRSSTPKMGATDIMAAAVAEERITAQEAAGAEVSAAAAAQRAVLPSLTPGTAAAVVSAEVVALPATTLLASTATEAAAASSPATVAMGTPAAVAGRDWAGPSSMTAAPSTSGTARSPKALLVAGFRISPRMALAAAGPSSRETAT